MKKMGEKCLFPIFPARIILYIESDFMNFSALPKLHFNNIPRVQKPPTCCQRFQKEGRKIMVEVLTECWGP